MSNRLLLLTPAALAARPPRAVDLYRRRVAAGLTQADLSALTGIDRAYLSAWETGRETASPRQQARVDAAIELAMKKAAEGTPTPAAEREASDGNTGSPA